MIIKTRLGLLLDRPEDREVLTPLRWKKVSELRAEDQIAIPRWYIPENAKDFPPERCQMMGYRIGARDDAMSQVRRTKKANPVRAAEYEALRETVAEKWGVGYLAMMDTAQIATLAERYIPEAILLDADTHAAAAFLRGLFSMAGRGMASKNSGRGIRLALRSERLARETQFLLKRVGVVASYFSYFRHVENGGSGWWYELKIRGTANLYLFMDHIGFEWLRNGYGTWLAANLNLREKKKGTREPQVLPFWDWLKVGDEIRQRCALAGVRLYDLIAPHHDSVRLRPKIVEELARRLGDPHLAQVSDPDLAWDQVVELTNCDNIDVVPNISRAYNMLIVERDSDGQG